MNTTSASENEVCPLGRLIGRASSIYVFKSGNIHVTLHLDDNVDRDRVKEYLMRREDTELRDYSDQYPAFWVISLKSGPVEVEIFS